MNPSKTVRPAIAQTMNGPRGSDRLGSRINPPNNPNASTSQAPCPADNRGEDDYAYFTARPGINSRVRFPFENEFPVCVLLPGASAFVRISIDRDADGEPKRRARRALRFCEGGHA
jgi:hypothetical protein